MTAKVWTSTIKTLEKLGYKVRKLDSNAGPDGTDPLYALEYNGFLYSDWMFANELNHFAAGAERAMHVLNVDPTPTDDSSKSCCDAATLRPMLAVVLVMSVSSPATPRCLQSSMRRLTSSSITSSASSFVTSRLMRNE